jgi:hypothetical protein
LKACIDAVGTEPHTSASFDSMLAEMHRGTVAPGTAKA